MGRLYDAFGRQTTLTQLNPGGDNSLITTPTSRVVIYSYDAQGHIASVASPEGVIHYEYGALNTTAANQITRVWTTHPEAPTTNGTPTEQALRGSETRYT